MERRDCFSFFALLADYWVDGAVRALEGAGRGTCNFYPLDEDPPGATPFEIVHATNLLRLRHYAPRGVQRSTPLLVVCALIKRPFILDLLSGRSVIENPSRQGFDIYLVDWIPPTRRDAGAGFDTYINVELTQAAGDCSGRGTPGVSALRAP